MPSISLVCSPSELQLIGCSSTTNTICDCNWSSGYGKTSSGCELCTPEGSVKTFLDISSRVCTACSTCDEGKAVVIPCSLTTDTVCKCDYFHGYFEGFC